MLYQPPTGGAANDPYVGANPGLGIQGSRVPPKAIEQPQRELIALLSKSGVTPSDTAMTQVAEAVRAQAMNYRAAAGTANALTVTLDPPITAYSAGLVLRLLTGAAANSGEMTLNVDGVGAVALQNRDGTAIAAGQVAADTLVEAICIAGPVWRVLNLVPAYEAARIAFPTVDTYATPGTYTFTPGPNVKRVKVRLWGAGGSGGNSISAGSGGGGGCGGGYSEEVVAVSPGVGVTVTVGAGGPAPAGGIIAGGAGGGSTSFGAFLSATGGSGGNAPTAPLVPGTPNFGGEGFGVGGALNLRGTIGGSGSNGGNADGYYTGYGGLGGNAPFGGAGGCMTTGTSAEGGFPGGGGSGGGSAAGSNAAGGKGADGCVIIEYVE